MRLDAFDDEGRRVVAGARQVALAAHHPRIDSSHLLAACLDQPPLGRTLTRYGLDLAAARAALPQPAPDRELLAAIGIDIDPDDVRRRARSLLGPGEWPLHLHRRRSRPRCVVLDGDGRRLAFTAAGRKVLEVAQWRSKGSPRPDWRRRQQRLATGFDLLVGILADDRDPTCALLIEHGLDVRRAWHEGLFGSPAR